MDISNLSHMSIDELKMIFAQKLDILHVDNYAISFNGYNKSYKKFRWLDEGELTIVKNQNNLEIKLFLDFSWLGFVIFLGSLAVILFNFHSTLTYKELLFILYAIGALWTLHSLFYLWTILSFSSFIREMFTHIKEIKKRPEPGSRVFY